MADLIELLDDEEAVNNSLWALSQLGSLALVAIPNILSVLRQALVVCDYQMTDHIVSALDNLVDDPESYLFDVIGEHDPEFFQLVIQSLRDHRTAKHDCSEEDENS